MSVTEDTRADTNVVTSLRPSAPDGFLFASLGHRALALSIDCVPVLAVGYLSIRWGQVLGVEHATAVAILLALTVWVANRVLAVAITGRSIGKYLTGLTIAPTANIDAKVGFLRALGREALTLVYLIPLTYATIGTLLSNPVQDLGDGVAIALLWAFAVLLLPLTSLTRSPLRQCPVTDSMCRTVVLAD